VTLGIDRVATWSVPEGVENPGVESGAHRGQDTTHPLEEAAVMEPIPILIEKLSRLSDTELERSAQRYARRERRNGAAVIAHIAEISRRDHRAYFGGSFCRRPAARPLGDEYPPKQALHLELGYQNLFEYVSDRLGFQGGSAGLRIHVAKKARDCPRRLEALWSGDLCRRAHFGRPFWLRPARAPPSCVAPPRRYLRYRLRRRALTGGASLGLGPTTTYRNGLSAAPPCSCRT
jgi:hypothetical protein